MDQVQQSDQMIYLYSLINSVITPMQDALSDGTPMVVFSGQVPTTAIGTDAFQEADIIGISRACTKWLF